MRVLRLMARSPALTATVVLSLALGIGANTAIFSLIDALILRRLPVRHPEQLVQLRNQYPGEPRTNCCAWKYDYVRDNNHVFSGVGGAAPDTFTVRAPGSDAETLEGMHVTGDFFQVLGVSAGYGRLIVPDDYRPDAAPAVAVVSWSYWKDRFGLDPAILGKRISVNDSSVTVVGVTPRAFSGLQAGSRPAIWVPVSNTKFRLALIARLKPDVSIDKARAEMAVLFPRVVDELARNSKDPALRQLKMYVEPAGAGFSTLRDQYANPLTALMAVVVMLLLLACINIGSMLLARAASRRHEIAVRVSLGASRIRLVRQMMAESLALSAAGAIPALAIGYFGAGALVRIIASGRRIPGLPATMDLDLRLDAHVLLFTAAVSVLAGLLFGIAPAWNAFVADPAGALGETGTAGETRARRLFGKMLVAGQVGLATVLLSSAGLFVGHLANLERLDTGFERDHVLLVTLDPARSGYTDAELSRAYRDLLRRLGETPGVRSAAIVAAVPISGAGASGFVAVGGRHDHRYVSFNWVTPGFFATFGTPLLEGRDFDSRDDQGRPGVIINQAVARRYFATGNPIGKHVTVEGGETYEVVGLASDAKYYDIREPAPATMYFDMFRGQRMSSHFALRTNADPEAIGGDLRRIVREVLPAVPVTQMRTLTDVVDASIVPERMIALLSGVFGGVGTLLAAIGIYGLLAYTTARRVHEIGIRMALGATRRSVIGIVLRDALVMAVAGVALGIPIALWARTLAAHVFENLPVNSAVPVGFGAAVMIAVGAIAAYIPARRAAAIEPLAALRHE
jgi:predicted permease